MVYDEQLANRIRQAFGTRNDITERKMFGGLAFMLDGHMCCGIVGQDLMLRLGKDGAAHALEQPHVRPMDFTGRPMKNMVYIDPPGHRGRALRAWVETAAAYARSLPAKPIQ